MCAAPTNDRDARHLSLPGFGGESVLQFKQSSALIIGVGGTGCAAASALAAASIGTLTLNDFDQVDASNLARQTLYHESDMGQRKVSVAARRLQDQNPKSKINTIDYRLDAAGLVDAASSHDIVLDCSDNFATRFLINDAAIATNRPLVSGAAIRWEGQIAVFTGDYKNAPCYACLYSEDDESLDDCQGAGVLAPLPTIIGAMMAAETIKLLTQRGTASAFTLYDARTGDWRSLAIAKNPNCRACG